MRLELKRISHMSLLTDMPGAACFVTLRGTFPRQQLLLHAVSFVDASKAHQFYEELDDALIASWSSFPCVSLRMS